MQSAYALHRGGLFPPSCCCYCCCCCSVVAVAVIRTWPNLVPRGTKGTNSSVPRPSFGRCVYVWREIASMRRNSESPGTPTHARSLSGMQKQNKNNARKQENFPKFNVQKRGIQRNGSVCERGARSEAPAKRPSTPSFPFLSFPFLSSPWPPLPSLTSTIRCHFELSRYSCCWTRTQGLYIATTQLERSPLLSQPSPVLASSSFFHRTAHRPTPLKKTAPN